MSDDTFATDSATPTPEALSVEELPQRAAVRDAAASWHLEALVNSSDDAIISKTLDGVTVSWNRGAQELFGYSSDEMVGHSIATLVPPDRHDQLEQILASVRCGEHIPPLETTRVTKEGCRLLMRR